MIATAEMEFVVHFINIAAAAINNVILNCICTMNSHGQ